jgi:hypothetical protein
MAYLGKLLIRISTVPSRLVAPNQMRCWFWDEGKVLVRIRFRVHVR